MRLKIATWNMDHWKGIRRDPDHTIKAWQYARELGADIVLLQEAAPPPSTFDVKVFPPRDEPARWQSGGRATFGTAVALFAHEAAEIEAGELLGDRTNRLSRTHAGAFIAVNATVGGRDVIAVSLYGMLEGPLRDGKTYSTTSLHRSLSDLTPLLNARSKFRVVGGDLNASTQIPPPDRDAHRVVFDRFRAFGLKECIYATREKRPRVANCPCDEGDACAHVQTHRHSKSSVPWQDDYLFASQNDVAKGLTSCQVIDDERVRKLSDHYAVVAEFDS